MSFTVLFLHDSMTITQHARARAPKGSSSPKPSQAGVKYSNALCRPPPRLIERDAYMQSPVPRIATHESEAQDAHFPPILLGFPYERFILNLPERNETKRNETSDTRRTEEKDQSR
jgi:hypothetical protein